MKKSETHAYISKSPRTNYLEEAIKKQQKVPPVGYYSDLSKCYDKLSSSPSSIRIRRH